MSDKPAGVPTVLKIVVIFQGVVIAVLLTLFVYLSLTGAGSKKELTSYEECTQAKDSVIQESYPATCVAKNGQRFTQPLSAEEQAKLIPPSP